MEHARSLDFGLLLNSVQNGILAIDLTGAIVYCNSAAESKRISYIVSQF